MDTRILEELEAAYAEELNLVASDLGALEAAVEAEIQQLGRGLLQRLVKRGSNVYKGSSMWWVDAIYKPPTTRYSQHVWLDHSQTSLLSLPRLSQKHSSLRPSQWTWC